MHPDGTYDWSYGLHPLIRQPGCYFSRVFMHFTILSVTTFAHRPFRQVLHQPSRARSSHSTHVTHLLTHWDQYVHIRCLRVPTDVQSGRRHWLLSIWDSGGLGVEVLINGSGWVDLFKNYL